MDQGHEFLKKPGLVELSRQVPISLDRGARYCCPASVDGDAETAAGEDETETGNAAIATEMMATAPGFMSAPNCFNNSDIKEIEFMMTVKLRPAFRLN